MSTEVAEQEQLLDEEPKLSLEAVGQLVERVLGHANETPPPGEKTSARDDKSAAPSSKPKEGEEEPRESIPDDQQVTDWMTASDVRELAMSLNLTDTDLKRFPDQEAFETAASFLDRQLAAEGRKARKAHEAHKAEAAVKDPERGSDDAAGKPSPERPRDKSGRFLSEESEPYKPALDPRDYDEAVIKEFDRLRDHHEKQLRATKAELQAQLQEVRQSLRAREDAEIQAGHEQMVREFDRLLDAVAEKEGLDDLFGKAAEVGREHALFPNRQKVFVAFQELLLGGSMRGLPIAVSEANVKRAFRQEFADHLVNRAITHKATRLQAQSARKLGIGKTTAPQVYEGPPEKNPAILAKYRALVRERGGE